MAEGSAKEMGACLPAGRDRLQQQSPLRLIEVLKLNRVYMERWLRVPPKKWAPACRQAGIDFSNSPHCI